MFFTELTDIELGMLGVALVFWVADEVVYVWIYVVFVIGYVGIYGVVSAVNCRYYILDS